MFSKDQNGSRVENRPQRGSSRSGRPKGDDHSNQGDRECCSQGMPLPPQGDEQLDSEYILNIELITSLSMGVLIPMY